MHHASRETLRPGDSSEEARGSYSAHEFATAATAAGREVPREHREGLERRLREDLRLLNTVTHFSRAVQARAVAQILGHDSVPIHLAPALREYAEIQLQQDLHRLHSGASSMEIESLAVSATDVPVDDIEHYPEPERIPSDLSRQELEHREELLRSMRSVGPRARAKLLEEEVLDERAMVEAEEINDQTVVEAEVAIARRMRALNGDPLERERDRVIDVYCGSEERDALERGDRVLDPDRARAIEGWLREVDIAQAARDPQYFARWFGQERGAEFYDVAKGRRRFALDAVFATTRRMERIEEAMHAVGIDRDPLGALSLRAPDRPQDAGQPIDTMLAHALIAGWLAAAAHRNIEERMVEEDRVKADVYGLLGTAPELTMSDADALDIREDTHADGAQSVDTFIDTIGDLRRARAVTERRGESTAHIDGETRMLVNELDETRIRPPTEPTESPRPIPSDRPLPPVIMRDIIRIDDLDHGGWNDTFVTPTTRVSWRGESSHAILGTSAPAPRIAERAVADTRSTYDRVRAQKPSSFLGRLRERASGLLEMVGYVGTAKHEGEIVERQFDRLLAFSGTTPEKTAARIDEIVSGARHRLEAQLGDRATPERLDHFRTRLTRQLHVLHHERDHANRLRFGSLIRTAFDPRWQRRGVFGVLNRLLS